MQRSASSLRASSRCLVKCCSRRSPLPRGINPSYRNHRRQRAEGGSGGPSRHEPTTPRPLTAPPRRRSISRRRRTATGYPAGPSVASRCPGTPTGSGTRRSCPRRAADPARAARSRCRCIDTGSARSPRRPLGGRDRDRPTRQVAGPGTFLSACLPPCSERLGRVLRVHPIPDAAQPTLAPLDSGNGPHDLVDVHRHRAASIAR